MLHLALKAFYPSQAAVPAAARRHDLEVPGHDRFPRRDGEAVRPGAHRPHQPGRARARHQPDRLGLGAPHPGDEDRSAQQALDKYGFDAAFGGARRDEEKSRAKERIFSFRTAEPCLGPAQPAAGALALYNTRISKGESIRVFPLSNWTELDIWQYILAESIPIVPLYFAKRAPGGAARGTCIMVDDERLPLEPGETPEMRLVRFRTLGCYPLTGAIEFDAASSSRTSSREMLTARTSERQGRLIDTDEAASMEKKKREGYF